MTQPIHFTLVNPGDYDWTGTLLEVHVSDHGFGGLHFLVWVKGEAWDDAQEEVIEYMVDNNIGVGTYIHDDAQKVLDMLGEDPSPENVDKLYDGGYGDMTIGHGGYGGIWFITSHEWSMRNAPKDVTKLARKASERYVEEDETAVPTIIVS